MSDISWEEMAKMMKPGVRVVRGKDWHLATQDGNGPGTVMKASKIACRWQVKWDSGLTHFYSMGDEGKFELKMLCISFAMNVLNLNIRENLNSKLDM